MSSASGPMTCLVLLGAVGMYFAPDPVVARVRATVADALKPGQIAARQAAASIREQSATMATQSSRSQSSEIDNLKDQLRLAQAQAAALQIQLARQNDIQARDAAIPAPLRSLPRLATTSLVEARVLGDAFAESWRAGKLLNQGEKNGVRESSPVVQSRRPLVDLGRDAKLSPEDTLLLGHCVIGKIERVGKWTSTLVLLTDSEFRGGAQLVHQTDSGFVFGAKGILKGQGERTCLLDGIESTDSVVVGDAVYTTSREGLSTTPLYYGRVTQATLGPDDKEWKILVEPIPIPHDLATVQILRTSVNNDRLSAGL